MPKMIRTPPGSEPNIEDLPFVDNNDNVPNPDEEQTNSNVQPAVKPKKMTSNPPLEASGGHPSGKLGVVTRYRNLISELLPSFWDNADEIKELFKLFLGKVNTLYDACDDRDQEWLKPNRRIIDEFTMHVDHLLSKNTENWNPYFVRDFETSSLKNNKILDNKPNRDDEQIKEQKKLLIEESEKLRRESDVAIRNLEEQVNLLKIEAKRKQDDLASKLEKPIKTEPRRRNLDEWSLSNRSFSSNEEANSTQQNNALYDILRAQNTITEAIVNNQQKQNLPKKELEKFDGSDVTKYKMFLTSFERQIERICEDDADKLYYLIQYTQGRAKQIVQTCTHYDPSVAFTKAKFLLNEEYAGEYRVSASYIDKLENWPQIKSEDSKGLQDLSLFLLDCSHYLENMSMTNQLQSPKEIMNIVNKLPYKLRDRWRRKCHELLSREGTVKFKNLVDFVQNEAAVLRHPIFSVIDTSYGTKPKPSNKLRGKILSTKNDSKIDADISTTSDDNKKYCEYCRKNNHFISTCRYFRAITAEKKSEFVRKTHLCFACLRKNHMSKDCTNKSTCKICSSNHPTIMHFENKEEKEDLETPLKDDDHPKIYTTKSTNLPRQKIICPIIPVTIKLDNSKSVTVNCAFDAHATDCWINERALRKLGTKLSNKKLPLTISTMGGRNKEFTAKIVSNLMVCSINSSYNITIPYLFARPEKSWPFTRDDVINECDVKKYSYLEDVPFNFYDGDVDLLIGMNLPQLLKPQEIVDNLPDEPFAVKYLLGWAFCGPVQRTGNKISCNRVVINNENELDTLINEYFSKDYKDNDPITKDYSNDDKAWFNKVNSTIIKLPSNNYQVGLPVKDDSKFPNNKSQIFNNMLRLNKRLEKNKNLFDDYSKFMQNMIDEKFVEKIPESELAVNSNDDEWYLSHHPVYHKIKNKLRIVFHCSLKFNDISLNDNLLQGPDLTNSLFGVLIRFRQGIVAFAADIQSMFYQVRVPEKDANLLKFFWYDTNGNITEYRLRVHVFGATSSPSIANYALRQTTNNDCTNEVKTSILRNFYVDDLLKSVNDVSHAINLANEIRDTLLLGGFNLRCFTSNSPEFKASLSDEVSEDKLILCKPNDSINVETSTLGIKWNTEEDKLSLKLQLKTHDKITKRNILRTLASVYDPLGLSTPAIIPAKKIFQQCCKLRIGWDEELPTDLKHLWDNWLHNIKCITDYKVDRCIITGNTVSAYELHIFCDGSETAYGTVAYLRSEYIDNQIFTILIASKARVTPINNSTLKTVPRIELCSAKLAVELAHSIKLEIEFHIENIIYWSDSTVILNYIKNNSANYQRFVSNKVSFIRNYSNHECWKYVPTDKNPADMISRGTTPAILQNSKLWNNGPTFLENEKDYPEQKYSNDLPLLDPEIKVNSKVFTIKDELTPVDKIMSSVSSWTKLKNRIASFLLLKKALQNKTGYLKTNFKLHHLEEAEITIIKYIQSKYFSDDIEYIQLNRNLPKNSRLRKLFPIIDENGILRVGGRITSSNLPYDMKHPIIIPNSFIAKLIVKNAHIKLGHMGREYYVGFPKKKILDNKRKRTL